MLLLSSVIIGCFYVVISESFICETPNGELAQCVSIGLCPILIAATTSTDPAVKEFLKASACGDELFTVCCGTSANFIKKDVEYIVPIRSANDLESERKARREVVIKKVLPPKTYCGMQHWDDYLHTENENNGIEANVDEFPWLLALVTNKTYRCNGFLITNRFFVTTLGCYYLTLQNGTESKVLTGLHHIKRNISCVPTRFGVDDCTEDAQEVKVEKIFQVDSIVLVKVSRGISYSDFVRPICLPFEDLERPAVNDSVMISGWGKLLSNKEYVVIKKRNQQVVVNVNDENCKHEAIHDPKGAICTLPLQNSSSTACFGDTGGPIMYKYGNNWFAAGITIGVSQCVLNHPITSIAFTPEIVNNILDYIADDYFKLDNSVQTLNSSSLENADLTISAVWPH